MAEEEYFRSALSSFVNESASGGAIRHLSDLGYSISQISEHLDFPTPRSYISRVVWEYYISKGIIVLTDPVESMDQPLEEVSYIKETGPYGRTGFRRVVKKTERPKCDYIACNFGKKLYQNREGFIDSLCVLDASDREYILDLPWPLTTVWHIADERMLRITSALSGGSSPCQT